MNMYKYLITWLLQVEVEQTKVAVLPANHNVQYTHDSELRYSIHGFLD